jgi:hypothetical protein
MITGLLMIYINRGLFVAMPGAEVACSTDEEINSVLELVLDWAGVTNDVDEDGDCPESYSFSNATQPLIAQNLNYTICLKCPYASENKLFYPVNEAVTSIDYNRTIDHPPEELTVNNE